MESRTTICQLFGGNNFNISSYNWNTLENLNDKTGDVNKFIHCLNKYIQAKNNEPYYFGNFEFKGQIMRNLEVIDGSQRLATIQILLVVVFKSLIEFRPLSENESWIYEDIICFKIKKYRITYFEVEEDQFIKSKIINNANNTEVFVMNDSMKKIEKAFYFITKYYCGKDENYLVKTLQAVANGFCTNYIIKDNLHISIFTALNDKNLKR